METRKKHPQLRPSAEAGPWGCRVAVPSVTAGAGVPQTSLSAAAAPGARQGS